MIKKTFYKFLTLICLLIASTLCSVHGLRCYQCNSNTDTHCTEYFDKKNSNIQPQECEVYEAKTCVKATGMYKGEVGTHRFCASADWGDICEMAQRKGDYREYRSCVYTCTGNDCNSSTTYKFSMRILLILFCFVYFI